MISTGLVALLVLLTTRLPRLTVRAAARLVAAGLLAARILALVALPRLLFIWAALPALLITLLVLLATGTVAPGLLA